MPVTRLNHAVIYVRDLDRSLAFWEGLLAFERIQVVPGQAAFLRAPGSTNDHDLGLFAIGDHALDSGAGRETVGLYHLAFEVDTLDELSRLDLVMVDRGHLVGRSDHATTKSLYVKDPDGIEIELCWVVPAAHLTKELTEARGTTALDLPRAIAEFGGHTRGGVGISIPA